MQIMTLSQPETIHVDGTKRSLMIIDRYLSRLRNSVAADGSIGSACLEQDLAYIPFSSPKDVDEITGCATAAVTAALRLLSLDVVKLYLIQQTQIIQNSVYFLDRRCSSCSVFLKANSFMNAVISAIPQTDAQLSLRLVDYWRLCLLRFQSFVTGTGPPVRVPKCPRSVEGWYHLTWRIICPELLQTQSMGKWVIP
jgi:hypothetical protein